MTKGHKYITVLTDQDTHKILEVSQGRTISSVTKALNKVKQKDKVELIAMDMWHAYIKQAAKLLSNAKIAFDKFHIFQHLNNVIDATRKKENKELFFKQ